MSTQPENQNSAPWILVGLLALVASVFGFLFFQQKGDLDLQENEITARAKEIAFTKSKLDSVSRVLDEKIAEITRLGGNISELEAVKVKLESDLAQFRKSDRVDNRKYLAKIKDYEKYLEEKDGEIASLKLENERLLAYSDSLSNEIGVINEDRVVLQKRQQELADTVSIYNQENRILSEKVSLASALKAQNMNVIAVNSKGKERDKDAYKAKRVDKIKVAFNLAENPLTAQEQKEIYLRVLDPEGAILTDEAIGGGAFTTVSGENSKYSSREVVSYTNNNQKVEMVYDYSNQFRPGKYNIELFSEGYKIGNSNFVIR
jgi:chromosome segregation ATPase